MFLTVYLNVISAELKKKKESFDGIHLDAKKCLNAICKFFLYVDINEIVENSFWPFSYILLF